jgi:hypothetical protein
MKDVQNAQVVDREETGKQRRKTMKINNRWVMLGAVGVMSLGTMAGPLTSEAQAQKGRRNTAIGAGAATVYGALRGNRTMTVAGGLGTAYAYNVTGMPKRAIARRPSDRSLATRRFTTHVAIATVRTRALYPTAPTIMPAVAPLVR